MTRPEPRAFFLNRYFFPDESATSQLLTDLVMRLSSSGREVHVICSRQLYGEASAKLAALERIDAVVVHRLHTTRFGRRHLLGRALDYLTFHLACAAALLRLVRAGDIIVAETDPPLISIVAAAAARMKRALLINWLQDVFPEIATRLGANPLPALVDTWVRGLRNASLRAARANVVLGDRMKQYLASQQVPTATIHVIENWAITDPPVPKGTAESALRVTLGMQRKFVVEYSGNFGRAHEYETLLGAAEILRDDALIEFLMIGGGVNMEAFQVAVSARRLPNVHFLPYQPRNELPDSLAAADVHVVNLLPALEGLIVPSKFYGILAAARPVLFIGDPDGELARVVRDSRCGMVVSTGDSAALVKAIHYLQSNPTDRQMMAAASKQLLYDRYSASRAHDRWAALLSKVAQDAGA